MPARGRKAAVVLGATAVACLLASVQPAGGHGVRTLAGKVRVGDFVVPAGATRIVTGPLDLVAARNVTIDGTVLLASGAANVTFRARGTLRVGPSGRIAAVPGRRPARAGEQPEPVVQGGNVEFVGSKLVEINGRVRAPRGLSVKVASAELGTVIVRGNIETVNGGPGTPGRDGENAGSITLGGFFGANKRVEVRGTLITGDGGPGYSASQAELHGRANPCHDSGGSNRAFLELRGATDGGKGGSIRLWGRTIVNTGLLDHVGRGGRGGDAGSRHVAAPDGGANQGGVDLEAQSGRGGQGGNVDIAGTYEGDPIAAGRGGDAGSVRAAAGSGGPGCDGGRTLVVLDRPGLNGTAKGKGAVPSRAGGQFGDIELREGGNGGDSDDATDDGGDAGRVKILIAGPRAKKSSDPKPNLGGAYYRRIRVTSYANGGNGFDGCKSNPFTRGSRGGDGGTVAIANRVVWSAFKSFNGGAGGPGRPPGQGGLAGKGNRSDAEDSFDLGAPGLACPGGLVVYRGGAGQEVGWVDGKGVGHRLKVESTQGCGTSLANATFTIHFTETLLPINGQPIATALLAANRIGVPFQFYTWRFVDPAAEVAVTLQGNEGSSPTATLKFAGSGAVTLAPNPSVQTLPLTAEAVATCPPQG
jgi:hypothetical protein